MTISYSHVQGMQVCVKSRAVSVICKNVLFFMINFFPLECGICESVRLPRIRELRDSFGAILFTVCCSSVNKVFINHIYVQRKGRRLNFKQAFYSPRVACQPKQSTGFCGVKKVKLSDNGKNASLLFDSDQLT